MSLRVALWDRPPADVLTTEIAKTNAFAVEHHAPAQCTAQVLQDEVDIALVSTYMALQAADGFDALPGVGVSAWQYPFARLLWDQGLHDFPETVAYPRTAVQERFTARVILHEHYGADPSFVAVDTEDPAELQAHSADAALLVGEAGAHYDAGSAFAMDLGREWYELTNYPMVWGVFVMKRGRPTTALVEQFMEIGKAATEHRADWIQAHLPSDALRTFYEDDLRTGIGRLERASLTDLRTYLFYYNVTDEIPDMPFVSEDPDSESESEEAAEA